MSSLYTPVFFPPSRLTRQPSTLSSSNPKKAIKAEVHLLSTLHLSLSHLPPTLCPPSPSSSHVSSERVDNIRTAIENALEACDYDRSSGKWGLVKGNLRLQCSRLGGSGRYKWNIGNALDLERERKARDKGKEKDKQWVLADTEEEWFEWERQNQPTPEPETEAQRPPERSPITQSPMTVTTRVKTWQQNLPFHASSPLSSPARSQSVPALTPSLPTGSSVQLEEVMKKEKVAVWRGEIVEPIVTPKSKGKAAEKKKRETKVDKGKGKGKEKEHEKESSPLGFPVVKRTGLTSNKTGPSPLSSQATGSQVQEQELNIVRRPEPESVPESRSSGEKKIANEMEMYGLEHSMDSIPGLVMGASEKARKDFNTPPPPPNATKIQDVSEMSFLPPSFPHALKTSTPNPKNPKEKPPQIIPFDNSSSPIVHAAEIDMEISSALLPPTSSIPATVDEAQEVEELVGIKRPRTHERELMETDILGSPARKRPRTGTPTVAPRTPPKQRHPSTSPHRMDISPGQPSSPIHKMDVSPARSPALMKKGIHCPPPPDVDPPPRGPVEDEPRPPVARTDGVDVTPNRQLPTLNELLASDRQKEKGFPKSKLNAKPDNKTMALAPAREEKQKEPEKEKTPEPSPAKSLFAFTPTPSPLSPSNSLLPFRSPLTPSGLPGFTQNPGAFAPSYASGMGGRSYSYKSLERGSSGFLGFNSQFDVEGQVDRVSELLEKDVDFDGWLKSIPGNDGDANH